MNLKNESYIQLIINIYKENDIKIFDNIKIIDNKINCIINYNLCLNEENLIQKKEEKIEVEQDGEQFEKKTEILCDESNFNLKVEKIMETIIEYYEN
jgi:hypothetical protein